MVDKNYITIEGYELLKQELHTIVTVERPFLVQTVAWAASNGDRSENADYIYGKRKLRELDKQIYRLTKKLEIAEVVNCKVHIGNPKIFFGAIVTILRNDEIEQTIRIVGQDEIDPQNNYVSWTSPLARSLLQKSIGDTFEFILPFGKDKIEILDVVYK